jgi:hypothetical protein
MMTKNASDQTLPQTATMINVSAKKIILNRSLLVFLCIAIILGIGAFLRLWQINSVGFNTDEAVYSGQAAAIAQVPVLKDIFPVFRAHPLLFQFILALVFHFGVSDVGARVVAVLIGMANVFLVYKLGKLLYGESAGLLAALIMAVMPYHVVVTRQVLLDGPMVFFATLTLYLLARFANTGRSIWLHATGIGLGLTFLSKETGIIMLGAVYAFLALSGELKVRITDLALSTFFMALMIAPFPLSIMLAGSSNTGRSYLVWQLFRRANHTWGFYFLTVPAAIGFLVVALALLGLWLLYKERSWRERLLVWWIIVPFAFFELWPTKGFQYLLPIAPPFAVLAAHTLARWPIAENIRIFKWQFSRMWITVLASAVVFISLLIPAWQVIQPSSTGTFIAGTGGVPGGREAGLWIRQNIPAGATMLTIGPSMANIVEFYGFRQAYGLSVSPNPLRRNPSYDAVVNPDLEIRNGDLQYIVWDSFSAERSSFFSANLVKFTKKYHGRVIHTESVTVALPDGTTVNKPVIIIYEVRP